MAHFFVAVALLASIAACGKSSGPTGPDVVPEAERGQHLQAAKTRLDEPPQITDMAVSAILALPTFPRAYSRSQLEQISGFVTLDAHWLSDVVAGLAVGILWLNVVILLAAPRLAARSLAFTRGASR